MLIELVGDVLTQQFGPLSREIGIEGVNFFHHGIDQHFQAMASQTAPAVLISHTLEHFFTVERNRESVLQRMAQYSKALADFAGRGSTFVVINTLSPPIGRIIGTSFIDQQRLTADLNAMLFDCAAASPMVSVADIAGVLARAGIDRSINVQNELVMRMPYTRQVIPKIIAEYAKVIRERFVPRKKVLLLDADNTLWGGVIGEDGVEGIAVDTQFPGAVYRRFQHDLVEIAASGILLALVSKNNEADVRQPFDALDMPLKWDHFSAVRANWEVKSANIASIAAELNVGPDSMVFIDDNEFEIQQVSSALPMVDCYRFEARKADEALGLLTRIKDLNVWSLTPEDAAKTEQYRQEALRKTVQSSATSLDDYINSLDIRIEVGINRVAHVKRIAQLTNKTNQFNLTARRFSEAEILAAMGTGQVFDFRVIDRFGDMGIVGVSVVRSGCIEAFLMSCRALGRRIEGEMLAYVVQKVVDRPLTASYSKTLKNEMVADFYDENGFTVFANDGRVKVYRAPGDEQTVPITRIIEIV